MEEEAEIRGKRLKGVIERREKWGKKCEKSERRE